MIDITDGIDLSNKPKEHIKFGNFNSLDYDMWLVDRTAPTPSEKEVVESVPYMQGVHDFSNLLGERVYNNRTISYTFHMEQKEVERRKLTQTSFENELMNQFNQRLYDTYTPRFYYRAKCIGVSTQDDHVYNRLIITMDFDAYPFKIDTLEEGHDIWDEFNFEIDYAQPVSFEVNGELEVTIVYGGSGSVAPTVTASAPFEIIASRQTTLVPFGTSKNEVFRLRYGENKMLIKGYGTIDFKIYKELI